MQKQKNRRPKKVEYCTVHRDKQQLEKNSRHTAYDLCKKKTAYERSFFNRSTRKIWNNVRWKDIKSIKHGNISRKKKAMEEPKENNGEIIRMGSAPAWYGSSLGWNLGISQKNKMGDISKGLATKL
jgi:hypothetical protein